jgi:hypothetical protein
MRNRPSASHWALWAAALALLLKSAVPVLAATAAHLRGVPVAALCDVYGVALPSAGHAGHHHHHEHGAARAEHPTDGDGAPHAGQRHGSDHCALTSLAAMAAASVIALPAVFDVGAAAHDARSGPRPDVRDACAAWAARLQHAPPLAT